MNGKMPKCPNCKHKHDFWDVELMDRTHRDTESFIRITGCVHHTEDGNGYDRLNQTIMYGCPICKIVFWSGY